MKKRSQKRREKTNKNEAKFALKQKKREHKIETKNDLNKQGNPFRI